MVHPEGDILPTTSAGRNNGPVKPSVRKRSRNSSKNNSNLALPGQHSSRITSSDEGGSSDESSGEDMQVTDENTLRQLRALQDQVMMINVQIPFLFFLLLAETFW